MRSARLWSPFNTALRATTRATTTESVVGAHASHRSSLLWAPTQLHTVPTALYQPHSHTLQLQQHTSIQQQQRTATNLGHTGAVMDELLQKATHKKVFTALKDSNRVRMSYREYLQVCKQNGVSEAEAEKLSASLHDAGVCLRFATPPLNDTIIVKPDKVITAFLKVLDSEGRFTADWVDAKTKELQQKTTELSALESTKIQCDNIAYRKSDRIITVLGAYLVAQGAAVARLTWWELSWDIMEPITYMLTFATSVVGILYFSLTKTEYSYEALRESLAGRRKTKIYQRQDFDIAAYERLKSEVEQLQRDLKRPEIVFLEQIGHDE